MKEGANYATLDYDSIEHETGAAVLFKIGDKEHWVPRSVIGELDEDDKQVIVEEWFAEKEGLI